MMDMDASHMSGTDHSMESHEDAERSIHSMMVTPELMGMLPGGSGRLGLLYSYNLFHTLLILFLFRCGKW